MSIIQLSEEQQCACSQDRFCSFIKKTDSFSKNEIGQLQEAILNNQLSKVLYVSATLAIWCMLAAWIDAAVMPAVIVYTINLSST